MGLLAGGFKAVRAGFFDAEKVLAEAERLSARARAKFGAFARRRMKSSLKYAKGQSAPGKPPHVHGLGGFTRPKKDAGTGATVRQAASPLRELIFFALDPAASSVVVGPVAFGGKGGVAPGLLERGGPGTFRDANTGRPKRGVWRPRPFVGPAGRAEARRFPEVLKSLVK